MRSLEFSPEALDDLHEIREYTLKNWGEEQAEQYLTMLEHTCSMLCEIPGMGQGLSDVYADLHLIGSGSHFIFYLLQSNRLLVIAIYHKRMHALERLADRLQ